MTRITHTARRIDPNDRPPNPYRPVYSWWPWIRARQKRCDHPAGPGLTCPKCGTRWTFG